VAVNAISLGQCSRLLIALIVLTSDCHNILQFVEIFSNEQLISCQFTALSFP